MSEKTKIGSEYVTLRVQDYNRVYFSSVKFVRTSHFRSIIPVE